MTTKSLRVARRALSSITIAALLGAAPAPNAVMQWSLQSAGSGTVVFGTRYQVKTPTGHDTDNDSSGYPLAGLENTFGGLTRAQLFGPEASVRFTIARQEGSISCTGRAKGGVATGDFTVTLDPAFAANLNDRGVGTVSTERQMQWLFSDIDVYGMLDYFKSQGIATPSVDLLSTAIDHGVTVRYARDLAAAGMHARTVELLVRAMDHGVSPRYVAAVASYGFSTLTIDTAILLVDHGVSSEYLAGLAKLGYRVTPDQAIELVDHGVTLHYIERLRDSGHTNLTVSDLVQFADRGIR